MGLKTGLNLLQKLVTNYTDDAIRIATKNSDDIAIEIYDCLNSSSYSEIPRAREIIETFNKNTYNIIEIIKDARKMGLNDAYSIIEAIW